MPKSNPRYLKAKAKNDKPFRIYGKVRETLTGNLMDDLVLIITIIIIILIAVIIMRVILFYLEKKEQYLRKLDVGMVIVMSIGMATGPLAILCGFIISLSISLQGSPVWTHFCPIFIILLGIFAIYFCIGLIKCEFDYAKGVPIKQPFPANIIWKRTYKSFMKKDLEDYFKNKGHRKEEYIKEIKKIERLTGIEDDGEDQPPSSIGSEFKSEKEIVGSDEVHIMFTGPPCRKCKELNPLIGNEKGCSKCKKVVSFLPRQYQEESPCIKCGERNPLLGFFGTDHYNRPHCQECWKTMERWKSAKLECQKDLGGS